MNTVRAIIFDLDGTLVSSSLDFRAIRQEIGCPPELDPLVHIAAMQDSAAQHAATAVILRHELADAEQAQWLPGAREFIEHLLATDIPLGIVTRNSLQASHSKMSLNNFPDIAILTRECSPAKPDPSALLALAESWQTAPGDVLMVGDYLYDIQAARNAGMQACLIHGERRPEYADLADYCFEDFVDLLECWCQRNATDNKS